MPTYDMTLASHPVGLEELQEAIAREAERTRRMIGFYSDGWRVTGTDRYIELTIRRRILQGVG